MNKFRHISQAFYGIAILATIVIVPHMLSVPVAHAYGSVNSTAPYLCWNNSSYCSPVVIDTTGQYVTPINVAGTWSANEVPATYNDVPVTINLPSSTVTPVGESPIIIPPTTCGTYNCIPSHQNCIRGVDYINGCINYCGIDNCIPHNYNYCLASIDGCVWNNPWNNSWVNNYNY